MAQSVRAPAAKFKFQSCKPSMQEKADCQGCPDSHEGTHICTKLKWKKIHAYLPIFPNINPALLSSLKDSDTRLLSSALLLAAIFRFVCFPQYLVGIITTARMWRAPMWRALPTVQPALSYLPRGSGNPSQWARVEQRTPLPAEPSHWPLTRIVKTGIKKKILYAK